MGLLNALNIAVSGLNVNQQNLDTLSQNISNANTPNYSTEVVNQQANFINGQPEGVDTASVTRLVNEFLNSEVQSQTSKTSAASVVQNYYGQIENLLGQPGSSDSIDTAVTSFFTSLQDLANSPSVSAETTVVNSATSLSTQMSSLANAVQGLQLQADQSITSAVTSVNTDLQNLYNVNTALERASATSQNNSGLLDQRDAALTDLAQYVDINPTFQTDGEVSINTTNGVSLLNGNLYQLNYSGAGSLETFTNNDPMSPLTVSEIGSNGQTIGKPAVLATGGTATSVTTSLVGGQIQGLLAMRDTILPDILGQLNQLASTITTQVNAVQNQGVSYPPPNSYTGTLEVTGNTTSQYSGNVQIAVLNSSGNPAASPYADETNGLQPLTLNLGQLNYGNGSGVLSVNNIISAINQYYGPPQPKLELGSLNNVQLALASNSVTGANGSTLNFGFNLNNISGSTAPFTVIGTPQIYVGDPTNNVSAGTITGSISGITVGSGQTVNTNAEAGGTLTATLNSSASSASYFTVVAEVQTTDSNGNTVDSTVNYQISNNLSNADNNLVSASSIASGAGSIVDPTTTAALATATLVNAQGVPLTETNGSYGNQQGFLKITADNSTETIAINQLNSAQLGLSSASPPIAGTGQGFSQYFGLNNFFNVNGQTTTGSTLANSALNMSVASNILNNPATIATATLALGNQPTTAGTAPNFTYQVASGDNSNAQALAGIAATSFDFPISGGMPASNTTLTQYAGQIIANTSTNSTQSSNNLTNSQALLSGFTQSAQKISGVNLDQQLANTVIYQNAYSASARVISVVDQLFTTLLGAFQ